MVMLRIPSPLPEDLERIVHKTIGCCIEVHRILGAGLLESPYSRASAIELTANRIPFEREKEYLVTYRGQPLCHHRVDFVVDGRLLLEIKAVDRLTAVHRAQVLSYLRVSKLPVGLLINFNEVVLQNGIKRIIL
jgi:GxxExxY protein